MVAIYPLPWRISLNARQYSPQARPKASLRRYMPRPLAVVTDASISTPWPLPILEFPDPRCAPSRAGRPRPIMTRPSRPARRHVRDHVRRARHRPGREPCRQCTSVHGHRRQREKDSRWSSSTRRSSPNRANSLPGGLPVVAHHLRDVTRANEITVQAHAANGQPFELHVDGLLAVCIHTNGPSRRQAVRRHLSPLSARCAQEAGEAAQAAAVRRRLIGNGAHAPHLRWFSCVIRLAPVAEKRS